MSGFASNGSLLQLRTLMLLGNTVTNFSDFFRYVDPWNKNKPTDGTAYNITPYSLTDSTIQSRYNTAWSSNAIASSHKKLSKFVGYVGAVSPVSGFSVSGSPYNSSSASSHTFGCTISIGASNSERISLMDIVGNNHYVWLCCVGSQGSVWMKRGAKLAEGTLSFDIDVDCWAAATYSVYPYIADANGGNKYSLPSVGSGSVTVNEYVPPIVLQNVRITGAPSSLMVDSSMTLTVYADYSDGNSYDVTDSVTWSYDSTVFSKTGAKTFTALKTGGGAIGVTYSGYNPSVYVSTTAKLTSISVSPQTKEISVGSSFSIVVTGYYWNGTQYVSSDVTNSVSWSFASNKFSRSGNSFTSLAAVSSSVITASYGGWTSSCSVTAIDASQDIAVTAAKILYSNIDYTGDIIDMETSGSISLSAGYSPSNANIASYSWSSSAVGVARVVGNTSATPTVTARAAGTSIITLTVTDTYGNTKTATVTVRVVSGGEVY